MKLKNILLLLTALVLFSCTSNRISEKLSDRERSGIKGKVKECTERHYAAYRPSGLDTWHQGNEYENECCVSEFTEDGACIQFVNYGKEQKVLRKQIPNRVDGESIGETSYGEHGEFLSYLKLIKKTDKETLCHVYLGEDSVLVQKIQVWTKDGLNVESLTTNYDKEGNKIGSMSCYLDENGWPKQLVIHDREREKFVIDYEYQEFDEHGNWTKAFVRATPVLLPTKIYIREYTYY